MNNTYSDQLPMPDDEHMPPLPKLGEVGPHVCETVQLYLGVLSDLTTDEAEIVLEHVRACADCATVQRMMQGATHVVAGLPDSMPSAPVDEAVMAVIAARGGRQRGEGDASVPIGRESFGQTGEGDASVPTPRIPAPAPTGRRHVVLRWRTLAAVAMAAVLLLSLMTMMHFLIAPQGQAFMLPVTLSWNSYVVYHSETRIDAHGVRYHVDTYYDPSNGRVHVETVLPGSVDVVAVGDDKSMLGMDMMHHVAQWDANGWSNDESMFNLAKIRNDLKTSRAAFIDKDVFRGQAVYRIRCSNGLILLLNMRYEPVNVLRGAVGPGTGEPIYDALLLMPSSHVSSDMWNMSVPAGFRMGTLPGKP
ncbi:MAG: hypothetical protein M3Y76_14205 [Chloroflexota bacterium]|nr:hypothetical protein [Chloroflexota bacterium]